MACLVDGRRFGKSCLSLLMFLQAQQMLCACLEKVDISNTEGYDLFLTQLKEGLKNTSHETAANHKVAKVSHSSIKEYHSGHLGFILTFSLRVMY